MIYIYILYTHNYINIYIYVYINILYIYIIIYIYIIHIIFQINHKRHFNPVKDDRKQAIQVSSNILVCNIY